MALKRASTQSSRGLYEFYRQLVDYDLGTEGSNTKVSRQMLELLPMLEDLFLSLNVWGLTSMERLCLLADDDWRSPWFVIIQAKPMGGFQIQYRMSQAEAPWPNAIVEGFAEDKERACELIRIAMQRSGGWPSL
jgi:hypothetical protein